MMGIREQDIRVGFSFSGDLQSGVEVRKEWSGGEIIKEKSLDKVIGGTPAGMEADNFGVQGDDDSSDFQISVGAGGGGRYEPGGVAVCQENAIGAEQWPLAAIDRGKQGQEEQAGGCGGKPAGGDSAAPCPGENRRQKDGHGKDQPGMLGLPFKEDAKEQEFSCDQSQQDEYWFSGHVSPGENQE